MAIFDLLKSKAAPVAAAKPAPAMTPAVRHSYPVAASVRELPASVRAKSREKLKFIQMVWQTKKALGLSDEMACAEVAARYHMEFPILSRAGHGGNTALIYPNYRNWARLVKQSDGGDILADLAEKRRRGQLNKEQWTGEPQFWDYLFGFYLNTNRLPLAEAYRLAAKKTVTLAPKAKIPSFRMVNYRASQLPIETVILGREGESAYTQKVLSWIKRDWMGIDAGQVVIGDSRPFDTRVKVWDDKANKWVGRRPTITALIDGRSWYYASYWITTEAVNADMLINTLALYCRNNRNTPPGVAYFDNGKDYCAQGFSTPLPVGEFEHSIFKELGITLVNSTAYNARAKTIERSFRDMMQRFDKLFPDYLGSNPLQRTDAAAYYDDHPEELPTLGQFLDIFAGYIEEYHSTPKHGDIHRGLSPRAIWDDRPTREPLSDLDLVFGLMRPEGVRQVGRGPSISLDRTFYYANELRFGDKVLLKRVVYDPTVVHCFTPDGAYICEARTRDAIKALATDDADRAELKALIAGQRRQLADAKTALNDLTGKLHQFSPLELLLAAPGAEVLKLGSRNSVKGHAHEYTRQTFAGIEFAEDAAEDKLAEFGKTVTQPAAPPEEQPDPDKLTDFQKFMTSRSKRDEF